METIWLYQFRLIVIGDSTVGKSCLIRSSRRAASPRRPTPPWGWTFSPAWWRSSRASGSSCRSGTRRARRGSGPSREPTTGTRWAASCSSTSPTAAPSRTSTTGWRRPRATSSPTTSSSCWWATSVTWRPCARSPGRRPRGWPGPSGCATWRPRRWTPSTWRRPLWT
ncbi:unnamed protein product [Tetraodon nigroviridis]|uniref:(spotted green pufferfish) hypothetical protein n=1 Tax=Tetraodon nigroviridis TaxID=99883 RepID=Q4RIP6_TETNG|nr:unnamed protein product [Tetraodon nigroviridis]